LLDGTFALKEPLVNDSMKNFPDGGEKTAEHLMRLYQEALYDLATPAQKLLAARNASERAVTDLALQFEGGKPIRS